MKKYALLFCLIISFSFPGQQAESGIFSITDENLLMLIAESPNVDLSIADDSTIDSGEPVVYYLHESLELHHHYFLRAVDRLRQAVMLKGKLVHLQETHPELRHDARTWRLLADT